MHIESVNEDFPEDSILFAEFEVVIEDEVLGERAAVGGTSGGREPEIWEGAGEFTEPLSHIFSLRKWLIKA